jgi:hypothetical protein
VNVSGQTAASDLRILEHRIGIEEAENHQFADMQLRNFFCGLLTVAFLPIPSPRSLAAETTGRDVTSHPAFADGC